MKDQEDRDQPETCQVRLTRLLCKRTGEQYDLQEHQRCPYCWGGRERLERGRHADFCDYDPERDPVHFGFPAETARHRSG